ncbi:MAG: D-alanine--poly(phosphoribitol) ligase subunit DltC [Streptococcaceae bacterium]|jgi:D-alanine--poly(phosphoribitol) ligase subunit 2|nr:D-alanine--poly(phosphoribitol) ligase subunit DltC [Streptococcaceae bacterium]
MDKRVYDVIERVSGSDEFLSDIEMDLFEEGILDSMRAIMLIVELENEFDVSLPPSEMDRDEWNTASKIVKRIEEKLND